MGRRRSRFVYPLALAAIFLSGAAAAQRSAPFYDTDRGVRGFEDRLKFHLMKGLVFEHHLPRGDTGRLPEPSRVAYVLGGTQESLSYKVKTVGRLYAEGTVGKILVLHRPGITEYSPTLGRNLSNDEWATGKLKEEGCGRRKRRIHSRAPGLLRYLRRSQGDFLAFPLAPDKKPGSGQFNASHETRMALLFAFQCGQRVRSVYLRFRGKSGHHRTSDRKPETPDVQVYRPPARTVERSFGQSAEPQIRHGLIPRSVGVDPVGQFARVGLEICVKGRRSDEDVVREEEFIDGGVVFKNNRIAS